MVELYVLDGSDRVRQLKNVMKLKSMNDNATNPFVCFGS